MRSERKQQKLARRRILLWAMAVLLIVLGILFWRALPSPLFGDPYSTVLTDVDGKLLGARVADDQQWRFPPGDTIPGRFSSALLMFEDRRFYRHPGIRLGSLARAAWQNLRAREVVSGGSTLTMQVVRMWRKGKPRTIWEKGVEIVLALRLELSYSKREILELYCAHAPFGGNVVGLEAASWRYYACPPEKLSWSEAATLAVLPNSPGLIYPGRGHEQLLEKRNRLLGLLLEDGSLDSLSWELACAEPLPGRPKALPSHAYHLLHRTMAENGKGKRTRSTVSLALQAEVQRICLKHQQELAGKGIHNIGALVIDTRSGACRAYVGNVNEDHPLGHAEQVDMVTASRSTGSILKPFLYAAMLSDGELLPHALVPDIPTFAGSFHPENYDESYSGAIPASGALARSLNVPAVRLLQQYGVGRFHSTLTAMGMGTLNQGPTYYGLTLILGGAEGRLWDICGMYAGMGRQLLHYCEHDGTYLSGGYHAPWYDQAKTPREGEPTQHGFPGAAAAWFTFRALAHVNRPYEESHWRRFSSSTPIAWKTGTSYGFRDAWAIATTPDYVVGVWTGNADGEGRAGLTGLRASAPVLFEILNILNPQGSFPIPYDDLRQEPVCRQSGFRAGPDCDPVDTVAVPSQGYLSPTCPYHTRIFLDPQSGLRVSDRCRAMDELEPTSWFILPPEIELYYIARNPLYRRLPSYAPGCAPPLAEGEPMALIYPRSGVVIGVPRDIDGSPGKVVFEAAHRDPQAMIFWFIDGVMAGSTRQLHNLEMNPGPGVHKLTLTDTEGRNLDCTFEVVSKE